MRNKKEKNKKKNIKDGLKELKKNILHLQNQKVIEN